MSEERLVCGLCKISRPRNALRSYGYGWFCCLAVAECDARRKRNAEGHYEEQGGIGDEPPTLPRPRHVMTLEPSGQVTIHTERKEQP